jgi:uncharacterized protein
VLKYGLIFGLVGNLILAAVAWAESPFPPSVLGILGVIGYAVGVAPLALAYIAGIALLWQIPAFQRFLKVLAPAGRMAMTNYLMQTLIALLIFYGYGLGFYGKIGPTGTSLIAIGVFGIQIIFSTVWLRYFIYGPMEWIWRQLTYKQVLPIRRPAMMVAD